MAQIAYVRKNCSREIEEIFPNEDDIIRSNPINDNSWITNSFYTWIFDLLKEYRDEK